jgi:hypothetical protein
LSPILHSEGGQERDLTKPVELLGSGRASLGESECTNDPVSVRGNPIAS